GGERARAGVDAAAVRGEGGGGPGGAAAGRPRAARARRVGREGAGPGPRDPPSAPDRDDGGLLHREARQARLDAAGAEVSLQAVLTKERRAPGVGARRCVFRQTRCRYRSSVTRWVSANCSPVTRTR